jgi:Flp pilus assembly protein TadG
VPRPARPRGDDGSAVAEFVFVSVFLIVLVLAILQVAMILHMRNVSVAAVVDGARYAANADRDCADGTAKATELIEDAIAKAEVVDVSCETVVVGGADVVRVSARVRLPLLLLDLMPTDVTIEVQGRSVKEGQ